MEKATGYPWRAPPKGLLGAKCPEQFRDTERMKIYE